MRLRTNSSEHLIPARTGSRRRVSFTSSSLLILGGIAACSTVDPGRIGNLRLQQCSDTVPAELAVDVGCATIDVPQVHGDPSSGKISLRLFASAAVSGRGGVPVVYLAGGPGGSIGSFASTGVSSFLAKTLDRDVVLLEQRGNVLSQPFLDCKLEAPKTDEARLRQCVMDLRTHAIRLEAFNTIESAHDIDDVRRAIGAEKVFLWGGSYGALLAGAFAREHPTRLAGLVLEASVLGDRVYRDFEQAALFASKRDAFTSWLKDACGRNADCATAYPGFDPEVEMSTLLERAKLTPITLSERIVIDSPVAMNELLFRAMYSVPNAVLLLRAIWASNREQLAAFSAIRVGGRPALEYLEEALDVESGPSSTTNVVVDCYDVARTWTDQGLAEAIAGLPDGDRESARQYADQQRAICSSLPAASADPAGFGASVTSAAPTLFLGGQLDPVTPVEWALEDAQRFPNSRTIVSSCSGHGVFIGATTCYAALLRSFVDQSDNPETMTLDRACIDARCNADALTDDIFVERAR